ncbi:uncharacterized protein APUU_20298S [Aspergillus puulaauensis]|uniref:Uncharacterized protein n=1 Tax=Aspergillus puulaauensis TaxID=1220207 RepID=A0A7R7XES4_9EURO|nr:uncharacterized protein APUU_20298S [Aspergillus puulaauensis]BCS19866.1 hypothetical protein APUU_20298S [Aspergillus puulaauensis]
MSVAPSPAGEPRRAAPSSSLESGVSSVGPSKQHTMLTAAAIDIDPSTIIRYKGPGQLLKVALEKQDALRNRKTEQQTLIFKPVTEKQLSTLLDHIQRHSGIFKVDYDNLSELLVLKVMPGWDHEYATAFLTKPINKQLDSMDLENEYCCLASPGVELHNGFKEPDACWIPKSSPRRPTCVVEIGTSEPPSRLAIDAHRWLETSNSSVRLVITVCFRYLLAETDERPLTISVWSLVHQQHNTTTRDPIALAKQTTILNVGRKDGLLSVSGSHFDPFTGTETEAHEIRLPLPSLIGRTPANPRERDVILTKESVLNLFEQLLESRRV